MTCGNPTYQDKRDNHNCGFGPYRQPREKEILIRFPFPIASTFAAVNIVSPIY